MASKSLPVRPLPCSEMLPTWPLSLQATPSKDLSHGSHLWSKKRKRDCGRPMWTLSPEEFWALKFHGRVKELREWRKWEEWKQMLKLPCLSTFLVFSLLVAQKAMFVFHGVSFSPNSFSEAHVCFWLKNSGVRASINRTIARLWKSGVIGNMSGTKETKSCELWKWHTQKWPCMSMQRWGLRGTKVGLELHLKLSWVSGTVMSTKREEHNGLKWMSNIAMTHRGGVDNHRLWWWLSKWKKEDP